MSFCLKISHKVFNEATCAIQFANAMYSFLQESFFPTRFSDGVFNETCAYHVNRPRWSVVKHTRNHDPSPSVRELLPNS